MAASIHEIIGESGYQVYCDYCNLYGSRALGDVLYHHVNGVMYADCFGQFDYGKGKVYTNYDALYKALSKVFFKGKVVENIKGCSTWNYWMWSCRWRT